jgi:glycosyltransferase involved in cell wall biosynthesis
MRALKILHLVPHLERGGTQRWLLDVVSAGRAQGHPVHHHVAVLGQRRADMYEEFERESDGLHILALGGGGVRPRALAMKRLVRLVGSLDIDLLQAHSRFDRPYAYVAGTFTRRPVVSTLHSEFAAARYPGATGVALLRNAAEIALERVALRGVLAASPHLLDTWQSSAARRRVVVAALPPTVAPSFFRVHAPVAAASEPVRLVTVARLVPGKGIDVLVRAMPAVRRALPGVRLSIIGDGPDRQMLQQLVVHEGVEDVVDLVGNIDEVAPVLARHHSFVLPTASEGLGKAPLEAACAGLALSLPNLPSLTSLVTDLRRYARIEELTPSAVARTIIDSRPLMADAAAQQRDMDLVRERLDGERSAAALYRFWLECLDVRRSGPAGRVVSWPR